MIIAAHCGTGKTTLAAMYPDKVADFVIMPYKYDLEWYIGPDDPEKIKATPLPFNPAWPYNYYDAVLENRNKGKIILIPPDRSVLDALRFRGKIPYTLCYPVRSAKEVYLKRFIERGNTQDFLSVFIDNWDFYYDLMEGDTYAKHIVMQPHQFLSDVIDVDECLKGGFVS